MADANRRVTVTMLLPPRPAAPDSLAVGRDSVAHDTVAKAATRPTADSGNVAVKVP
jgi:hypothetical protein